MSSVGYAAPAERLMLEAFFGVPLLSYLCATDEGAMRHWIRGDVSLGATTLSALAKEVIGGWLLPLARRSSQQGGHAEWELEAFIAGTGDGTECLGSWLRKHAGGDIYVEEHKDPDRVKAALVRIAVDAYPLLLAPSRTGWVAPSWSLYRHPLGPELLDALLHDPVLTRLYGDRDKSGRHGWLVNSFGRGRTTQDSGFGEEILLASWNMVKMASSELGVRQLVDTVKENVDRIREAVNGGHPSVPAKLIFTGFRMQGGRSIDTPWGKLRPIEDWERDYTPTPLRHSVSGTSDNGEQVSVSYGGEVVMDLEVPYRVEVGDFPGPDPSDDEAWYASIERLGPQPSLAWIVEAVALALVMSAERVTGSWVVARLAWMWVGDPLERGQGVLNWNDTQRGPGFMPSELSIEEGDSAAGWSWLIQKHWNDALDVPVKRLLSAADSRVDPADRLIDSVIVWESLFGTRQGESALRISAALAWLLEGSDLEARTKLRAETSRIYGERSGIVHGRAHQERALRPVADRALEVSREAIRQLFEARPDLLAIKDTSERSVKLLLGG